MIDIRGCSKTTRELLAEVKDPSWPEKLRQRNERRKESYARMRIEEEPLLAELRNLGWDLESAWDLVMISNPYPEIIDVLLKHLQLPYSDKIKEGIARALAIPEEKVYKAWHILVTEYLKAPSGWGIKIKGDTEEFQLSAKDGLACTLAVAVTDKTLGEFIELVKNKANGGSRVLMLSALKKRMKKHPYIEDLLEELVNDPDLGTEITSWLWWKKRHKK